MLKQLTLYMHKVLVTKDDKSWKILNSCICVQQQWISWETDETLPEALLPNRQSRKFLGAFYSSGKVTWTPKGGSTKLHSLPLTDMQDSG